MPVLYIDASTKHSHLLQIIKMKHIFVIIACLNIFSAVIFGYALNAYAIETYDFHGITIYDSDGNVRTEYPPGETLKYEASFSMERSGVAVLHGTVSGENWSDTLRPKIHFVLKGENNISWEQTMPADAKGQARVDIVMLRPFRERVVRAAFFSILSIDADFTGSYACRFCHQEIYDSWNATRHSPIAGCETCHGPGSEHSITQSRDYIVIDRSPELCGKCHIRNDSTVIEAKNGFIRNQQQFNEWRETAHGKDTVCNSCHNTHFSLAADRQKSIKAECRDCHKDKTIYLNMQALLCEDCHMPFAVLKSESRGDGLYRKADMRSHVWRIKGDAEPGEMFNSTGNELTRDSGGPFLTLNFSCLGCHNGQNSVYEDFEAMQQTFTLIH